jgi:hypothetical protein
VRLSALTFLICQRKGGTPENGEIVEFTVACAARLEKSLFVPD